MSTFKSNITNDENTNQAQMSKLYHQALLKHHRNPTGFNISLSGEQVSSVDGENPECGDEITVSASVENQIINGIAFSGESCAICRASASMMCEKLALTSVNQALSIIKDVQQSFTQQKSFGDSLSPLNSVFSLPIRHQCALLPWRTARQILEANE